MEGRKDGWMDRGTEEGRHGWKDRYRDGWMVDGTMDRSMVGWCMFGRVERRAVGSVDESE